MQARIASIFFAPVKAERIYGGVYELPAVRLGALPEFLQITDKIQVEQGPYQLGSNGKRSRRQHLVRADTIAHDVVNEWTQNGVGMTPQCHPGIWVVRERVPLVDLNGSLQLDADGIALWREAEDIEKEAMWVQDLAAARAADQSYANMLFMQGNAMADDPRLIPFIAANARLGARQYGLDAEWLRDGAALNVKTCAYCTKVIPAAAIKCPKCTEIVDVEGYAVLEAAKQVALKAAKEAARSAA